MWKTFDDIDTKCNSTDEPNHWFAHNEMTANEVSALVEC